MSLDARIIPAKKIDAHRVELYAYKVTDTLSNLDAILPSADTDEDEPLGAAFSETPEEIQERFKSTEQIIEKKLAQTEKESAEKIAQAEKQAASIIAQAEQKMAEAEQKMVEAEQKVVEAEQQVVEIGQRAYEEGYALGEKEGNESAENQFKVHIGRLEDSLKALSDAVSLHKSAAGEEVLALITVMAEYLAAQHLESAEDAVGPLLNSILEAHPFPLSESAAPSEPALVVFLHPKDLEHAQSNFTKRYPGTRLLADAELSRGSFRLETADTVIDATFERRRERLLSLVNRLREEGQI
ncbi:MAG: hypothetical protein LBQ86_07325 [Holophagales bacterium]|jgi:flagellar biosynthesis/type III secretory pathway protein FliH|nr:hypothetical protein [Holophagales bacterium]